MKKVVSFLFILIWIISIANMPVSNATSEEDTFVMKCLNCNFSIYKSDFYYIAVPPSCDDPGIAMYKCSNCRMLLSNTVVNRLPPHVPSERQEGPPEPTCTERGEGKTIRCANCGTLLQEPTIYPPLGHDIVIDEAVAPSCTESGLTEGKHCTRCKDETVAQKVIEPTGHDYDCVEKIKSFDYVCHCGDSYSEAKVVGDIDKSGYISINDVTKIQKTSSGYRDFTEFDLIADVDSSGDLTIRDATYIQLYLAKLIDEFPIIIPEE